MSWRIRWRTTWPEEAERSMVVSDFALKLGRGSNAFTVSPSELVSIERVPEEGGGGEEVDGTPVPSENQVRVLPHVHDDTPRWGALPLGEEPLDAA